MPRAKRDLTVKTPGVTPEPAELSEEEQAAAIEAAVNDTSDIADPAVAAVADAMPPDIKMYIDAQIAKGVAQQVGVIRKAQRDPKAPAVALPDQESVDARKIDKITLTKQGYVVPVNHGAAPRRIATQIALGTGMGISQA